MSGCGFRLGQARGGRLRLVAAHVHLVRLGGRRYILTMLDWTRCDAVERIPERFSGAWTFRGTRVPVKALFENLESGATVEQFLQWFPGVTRQQVEAVLTHAAQSLTEV